MDFKGNKYFSGEIFSQLENKEKEKVNYEDTQAVKTHDLDIKRIKKSIFSNIGILTEKFIKHFYTTSQDVTILKTQEHLTLKKDEYLLRNSIIIQGIEYGGLSIRNINIFPKFDKIIIRIDKDKFMNYIFKDILNQRKKDFKDDKFFNIENYIISNYFNKQELISHIKFLNESIEINFVCEIKLTSKYLNIENSLFKELSIFSNQKQSIREDLHILNKITKKESLIEVKSRALSGLSKTDIYSSIYYPIYYSHIYKKSIDLNLIYLGENKCETQIEEIKNNYSKTTKGNLKITSFERVLNNNNINFNISGYKITGKKNKRSDKYNFEELYGENILFILDYEYNLNLEIVKANTNNPLLKEIRRDSNINL